MVLTSCFYVVTAHLGGWFVRFGAWLAGIRPVEPESSPISNFLSVAGDPLARAIIHGLADAQAYGHSDQHAMPEIRDAVLQTHVVESKLLLPPVRVENNYMSAGGSCRHANTPAAAVRRDALGLLAIAEHLERVQR